MTSGSPSDAGLVYSALGGDVASLSTLLDRYRASLYARALACLGQPEDAADAVQETFLLALTRLGQIRDPEAIGVRLGAIDGDPGVRPSVHQFVAYAAPWEQIPDDGLPRYPERRPPD